VIQIKILTISGERPSYIRLIPTIRKLDKYFNHKLIWAGQNFEDSLSTQFFKEFNRFPDINFSNPNKKVGIEYFSYILPLLERICKKEKPDCVLVLGDTNASLSAIYVAKRLNIPIYHLESGNRCYDTKRVPEEINRHMIDSISDWHLCYTQRAREQLLLEGKHPSRVMVVGNPIVEAIKDTKSPKNKYKYKYYLATIHRKENINNELRLFKILTVLNGEEMKHKVIMSFHPSLKAKMKEYELDFKKYKNIKFIEPPNFRDFLSLEKYAQAIISDSGTIPEEATILNVPCVLLRFSTERPELLESNSMVVCSCPNELSKAIEIATKEKQSLNIKEYHTQVSSNVVKILMRYQDG